MANTPTKQAGSREYRLWMQLVGEQRKDGLSHSQDARQYSLDNIHLKGLACKLHS